MKKTDEEIKAEIAALMAMKPGVRSHSIFGDDNHAAIDAQLRVLTEQMSEDAIYAAYADEDAGDFDQYILDSADHAYFWMSGQPDYEAPSADWMSLVKPTSDNGIHH